MGTHRTLPARLLAGALSLSLLVAPALAAENFPAVNTYTGFDDVAETAWYYSAVKQCYETGLMNGTGKGNFSPDGTMSLAESAAVAARLGSAYPNSPAIPQKGEGEPWYQPYVSYFSGLLGDSQLTRMLITQPTKSATRQEFFYLLAAAIPEEELAPINSITSLPDTSDESVLAFYNAGILTGTDKYGTFSGSRGLQRSEVAAMVARIADPTLRQSFIPQEKPADPTTAPAVPTGDALVTVNGHAVSQETFLALLCNIAYNLDYNLYYAGEGGLDWNKDYGMGDTAQYVLSYTKEMAVYRGLVEIMAEEMGCSVDQLPYQFTPDPSQQQLQDYVQKNDLLCAKHILCPDDQTAQAVLDGLEAVPTLEQFDALLSVFGTDPGMSANPNGYLFTAGDMVPEFEAGVRALSIGSYTTEPVQSDFGYHVIWRLDPLSHPNLKAAVQEGILDDLLEIQVKEAQVTMDEAAINAIDVPAVYNAFLATLAQQQ